MRIIPGSLAVLCALLLPGVLGLTRAGADGPATGKPRGDSRWPDLRRIHAPGLTSQERLELGLSFARSLTEDPPPAKLGMGGGPYSAGYAKAQVFHGLGMELSAAELRAARDATEDPELRDWLAVSLGFAKDRAVIDDLRRILVEAKDGNLREKAAHALGRFHDPELIPDFRAALEDAFVTVIPGPIFEVGPPQRLYPVRMLAAQGLRILGEQVPRDVYEVPIEAKTRAEIFSHMFDGKVPQSCLTGVQILATLGEEGRPYLEAFVRDNAANKDLAEAVKAAQAALGSPSPGK